MKQRKGNKVSFLIKKIHSSYASVRMWVTTFRMIDWRSAAPSFCAARACTFSWLSPIPRLPWSSEVLDNSHKPGKVPDCSLYDGGSKF
jgi:hypothetical protein